MQTAVTCRLRILDIILSSDKGDIILLKKTVRKTVNIIDKWTYDPYPGNIIDILFNWIKISRDFFSDNLADYTVIVLYPWMYGFYRISVIFKWKLLVKNLEFCFDLHYCAWIICKKLLNRKKAIFYKIKHIFFINIYALWDFCKLLSHFICRFNKISIIHIFISSPVFPAWYIIFPGISCKHILSFFS